MSIDYYFAPQSPWTYLGHERFVRLAQQHQAAVNVQPVDYGRIFPASGGLPLPKRAPQRQAYRLLELRRWRQWLGVPLNLQPRFFPVASDDAAKLIIAARLQAGAEAALALTGRILAAVWVDERDIADAATLAALWSQCGLSAAALPSAQGPQVQQAYDQATQAAIDAGIFGAPSYVIDGEIFWGQDRLDFVERKLRG